MIHHASVALFSLVLLGEKGPFLSAFVFCILKQISINCMAVSNIHVQCHVFYYVRLNIQSVLRPNLTMTFLTYTRHEILDEIPLDSHSRNIFFVFGLFFSKIAASGSFQALR